MAHRKMALTEKGAARGFYRTRMMKAGDVLSMDAPTAKFNERLGWAEPAPAKRAKKPTEAVIPTFDEVLSAEVVEEPAKKPRRTRKKAAKKTDA